MTRHGAANPNWKGGRAIRPDGYVEVIVGVGHPLADKRGRTLEHRVVASRKLGRFFLSKERFHFFF